MRLKLLLFFLISPFTIWAQVEITSIGLKESNDSRDDFSFPFVTYHDRSIAHRINSYLQKEILDNNRVETVPKRLFASRYIENDTVQQSGSSRINYKIIINNKKIVTFEFEIESTGAYSEYYSEYFNFNLEDGNLITSKSIFTSAGLRQIKKYLIHQRNRRIKEWLIEVKENYKNGSAFDDSTWIKETFLECNKEASEENILIKPKSILFYKEYCFPHVARPFDTDLDIELSYVTIKRYLTVFGEKLLLNRSNPSNK